MKPDILRGHLNGLAPGIEIVGGYGTDPGVFYEPLLKRMRLWKATEKCPDGGTLSNSYYDCHKMSEMAALRGKASFVALVEVECVCL